MLTMPAVFVAGILAFLSPCFLPVVPVFVAQMTGVRRPPEFIGQDSAVVSVIAPTRGPSRELAAHERVSADAGRAFVAGGGVGTVVGPTAVALPHTPTQGTYTRMGAALQALAFVASFSLVFAGLWAAVGVVGWVVGDVRQYLTIVAGAVLIALGLHVARLIRIPLLDRTVRHGVNTDGGPSYRKSVLLGLSFGAGWSPCIGPILGGVIALAMTQGTALTGFGLLLVFCAGLGLPFIASAILADRMVSVGWVTKHYKVIEFVLGLTLIVVGFLMISGLLERLSATIPAIL